MAPLSLAFGKPLRHASWRKLPVRQRLAFEAIEFAAVDPDARKSLSVFWHSSHVPLLAMLARVDCPGSLNVCLNVADLSAVLPALMGLLWCSGLVIVRDTDDSFLRQSLCSVPIAVDFAGFDDDPEFRGQEPPPVLAGRGRFELTSGLIQTASGPAAMAMGMVPIHQRLFDWLHDDADGIYETGRMFVGAFMPPTFVEAAFLDSGLFFHRSTGLLPTFVGVSPWVPDGPVTSHTIQIPYLRGCSVSDMTTVMESRYTELDARARALRALIDRAAKSHAMGGAPATEWEADRDAWEHAQVRLLEDVIEEIAVTGLGPPATIQTGAMTVYICSNVPRGGTWAQNIPQLRSDTDTFAGSPRGLALRRGPFAFATLAF